MSICQSLQLLEPCLKVPYLIEGAFPRVELKSLGAFYPTFNGWLTPSEERKSSSTNRNVSGNAHGLYLPAAKNSYFLFNPRQNVAVIDVVCVPLGWLNRLLMGKRLAFGTSGLRGTMGPGYCRMNDLVVIQVQTGFDWSIDLIGRFFDGT